MRVDITVRTPIGGSIPVAADRFTYGSPPAPPVPTVTVSASPNPAALHHDVAVTAAVSPTDGGGTVAFYDDGSATPIGGCGARPLHAGAGGFTATCSTSGLSAGEHVVRAAYAGDAGYAANTGTTSVTITDAPVNLGVPAIAGVTTEGETLSEIHGRWSNGPTSYSYRWQACDASGNSCTDIPRATAPAYVLSAAEAGHTIRVTEAATNAAGKSAPARSAATATVARRGQSGPPENSAPPAISGRPTVGRKLSASTGIWSGATPMTFAYRWQRCRRRCADIPRANGRAHRLAKADVGARIRVVVRATNAAGSASAVAAGVGPVVPNKARVRASLARLLHPKGRSARVTTILRADGYRTTFSAPSAGKLVIAWSKSGAVEAKLRTVFRRARATVVNVRLTNRGRTLLQDTRRPNLTIKVAFTPVGGARLTERASVVLKP
jgi:hypothetical protein